MSAVPDAAAVSIRPMHDADIDAVMAVEERAYPFPWTRGIFLDCLRVGYGCWVCESKYELCGYAVMSYGAGEAHLLNLCVAPEWQGMGLGRRLLCFVLEQAERLGAGEMFLEVRPSNTPALRLYRSLSFREIGRRKGYYPAVGGREDALVLTRTIVGRSQPPDDHV